LNFHKPESVNPFPVIVYQYRWKINIHCDIGRQVTVTQHFKPTDATASVTHSTHSPIGGHATYGIDLQFYNDPGFFQEIKVSKKQIKI